METKKLETVAKSEEQRFIQKITELESLTNHEKALAKYYFNVSNNVFEIFNKKLKKDMPAISWQNVEFQNFIKQMILRIKLGINPILPNMTNIIPYYNSTQKKYDLVFIDGYKGLEYMAKRFAINYPKNIIFELIYETDIFIVYKKDFENRVEKYKFEITNPLNRGEIVGAFYYMEYEDETKNKLVFFNLKQLEKRKPKYASVEFWGGEKDKWENGKIVGKEIVEGWKEEMYIKTLKRHCYNSFILDVNNMNKDDNEYIIISKNNNKVNLIENDFVEIENEVKNENENKENEVKNENENKENEVKNENENKENNKNKNKKEIDVNKLF